MGDTFKQENFMWGSLLVWANKDLYSGKIISILGGSATPLGYFRKQNKSIMVLQGKVQLKLERETKLLQPGDVYHLSCGKIYQLSAIQDDAIIIEVGTKLLDDFVEIQT